MTDSMKVRKTLKNTITDDLNRHNFNRSLKRVEYLKIIFEWIYEINEDRR